MRRLFIETPFYVGPSPSRGLSGTNVTGKKHKIGTEATSLLLLVVIGPSLPAVWPAGCHSSAVRRLSIDSLNRLSIVRKHSGIP